MKYLLYTVLLFVATGFGLNAQITKLDLSNLAPIRIQAEQIRVPFELSAANDLFLSDLTIGKEYQLYVILPGFGSYTFDVIDKKTGNKTSAYPFIFKATAREQNFILQLPLPTNQSKYGYITFQATRDKAPFSLPGIARNPPAIVTNSNISLQSLVEDYFIKSSCVAVSNITYTGGSNQRGTFANGNTSIGYSQGLMLASGGINVATGPNNATGAAVAPNGPASGNDPDLQILLNGAQNHKAILEFDFIPENDTVTFDYVFASEEYCDYTNTAFNDVFGFFLSGPGLSGPFSGGAVNIAVLPMTSTFVSINNVNHIDNSAYYRGNIQAGSGQLSNGNCAGHPGLPAGTPSLADCQFDGFTVPMKAFSQVVPCQTYHIKLAIADIADGAFDSGVFFKLNSFNAGDGSQAEVVYDANNPSAAIEGCSDVYYILTKPQSSAGLPYTVNLTNNASSTATAGLDYTAFPLTWVIPAGQDTIHVNINVLADLITEGNETIVLNLLNGCFCTPPQITLNIQDRPVLVVQLEGDTVCAGQNITLMPTVSGGIPPYTYLWSNSATTESIVVSLTGLSSFSVTVYDDCNQAKADTALYYISPPITAAITGDTTICTLPLGSATMQVTFTGPGPWEFVILKDGLPFNTFTTSTNPFTFPVNQVGTYTIGSVVNTGTLCDGAPSGAGTVSFVTIDLSITAEPFACLANQGSIDLSVGGGFPGYTYVWSGGLGGTQDIPNVGGGNYTVTVTDTRGCSNSASITVPTLPALMVSPGLVTPQNCNGGGSVTVNVNGGTPNYDFNWNNGPGGPTQNPVPGGTYSVTITDANGCTNSTSMVVPVDTIQPAANAGPGGLVNCLVPTLQLNGNGSAVGATITYLWQAYNGGNIVSGANTLIPIVNAGGIYELIVTNNTNGCTRTDTVQVQEDKVPPTADILPPLTLTCAVDTITLDGSGSSVGANFTYVWTTTGGLIVSGQGTNKIKVTKPGTYTLTVRNTTNGCLTPISVVVDQDIAKPDANAGPVKTITCDDVTVILTGGNSSGPEFDYSWTTINGNIISGEFSSTPEVDEPGLYTLYILNSTNGCKDTATVTVLINQVYPLAVGGPDTIINCYKPSTKLNGTGSNSGAGYTITWTTLDGNIVSGGNTLMPTINAEGTYVISVRNNVNGCITEDEALVLDVREYPEIIIDPPFDLNCAATEELLNASSGSFGPEFTYLWTTSGGNIVSGADTPYPIVNDDGTYTFKVTNIINGCFTVQSIEVYENFTTPNIVISPVDSITCLQPNVIINASGSSQGSIYQISWTTANGSITGGQGTLNPTVNAAGTYVLTMTHSNSLCVDIDSITVVADANIPVSNAGIPDTINCTVSLIQLQGTVSGGNNLAYGWTYTPGGNIASDSATLTPTVNAPGTYILTVTNLANSCVNTSSVIIALDTITPSIVIQPVPI
ncbi:MAG: choice-of-anchor L domain-containing protein, partial [Saprospiraceae bacterium]